MLEGGSTEGAFWVKEKTYIQRFDIFYHFTAKSDINALALMYSNMGFPLLPKQKHPIKAIKR